MSGPYQQQPTWSPQSGPGEQPQAAPPQRQGTVYGQHRAVPGQGQAGVVYGPPQPPQPPPGLAQHQPYPPYQYPSAPPAPRRNGFAIAALVFGILGGLPLAVGFGIAGLVRSAKVGRGRVMSIVGMALSVLWLVPLVYLATHAVKAADPGCLAGKATISTYGNSKLSADAGDPAALKNDLRTLVTQLNDAAAKSNSADARTSITKLATDFNELLTDLNQLKQPSADLQSRIDADARAVDAACGTIGS